jgi:hypothetical protein
MISHSPLDQETIQQQLGSNAERIRQLEQQVIQQRNDWESAAREWKRLEQYRNEIGEWLVDSATNERGHVVKREIDAALGGELYLPGMFFVRTNDREYQLELVSTHYTVTEI